MPTIFRREPRPRRLPVRGYAGTASACVSLSDAIDDHVRLVRAREARRVNQPWVQATAGVLRQYPPGRPPV